jgi:hypothetical protein
VALPDGPDNDQQPTQPGCRISASELKIVLKGIQEKAQKNKAYLFNEYEDIDVPLPTTRVVVNSEIQTSTSRPGFLHVSSAIGIHASNVARQNRFTV